MGSSPTANRAAALCPTKVTSGRSPTSPSTSAPPTPRNLDYARSPRILPRPRRFSSVVEQRFRKPQVSSSSLEIGSEVITERYAASGSACGGVSRRGRRRCCQHVANAHGGLVEIAAQQVNVARGRGEVFVPGHSLHHVHRHPGAQPESDGVVAQAVHGEALDRGSGSGSQESLV